MKSKTVLGYLTGLLLAVSPAAGLAQRARGQIVITPAPFAPPPVQGSVFGTRGAFNLVPTFVPPPSTIAPIVPLVPNFPTVIVSNQVLLPGQTFLPPPVVTPGSSIFFPANPIQPGLPFVSNPLLPGPFAAGASPVFPPVGMHRGEVLRQFGPPSVSVITSRDETMFFPGGGTVTIQNGQVVGPK